MTASAPSAREPLGTATVVALAAMSLAVFAISSDFISLAVALPKIERQFHTEVETVQWVMNAYAIVFGVLIVTGGRLSDMFGHRRAFFAGMAIFAVFSIPAPAAGSSGLLIGARAAMGIGGALVWPSTVALIFGLMPGSRVGLAGAIVLGVSGIGNALGPMIGGFLTDELSWRWILILNGPIAIVAITLVATCVKDDEAATEREQLDWIGIVALSIGLVSLLLALDQAPDWGWGSPRIIGLLVISVLGLSGLVFSQRRSDSHHLLIPRDVIGKREFAYGLLTLTLVNGIWFCTLLYAPQYTEKVLGFSAFGSGVALLPLMIVFSACAFAAGSVYNKVGPRLPLLFSACFPIAGLLLSLLGTHSSYLAMIPGLIVMGVGVGFFLSTLTNAALGVLDPSRTGVGSGLILGTQLVSGAIGVCAALGVVRTVRPSRT